MAEKVSLAKAREIIDGIRNIWPEKARELEKAIDAASSKKLDGIKMNIGIKFTLEKFDGEHEPGKSPVEVITGTG